MNKKYVFATSLLFLSNTALSNEIKTSISTLWESKYVTEGRKNIEGGLYSTDVNISYDDFTLGLWYGADDGRENNENYRETDAYLEKAFSWKELEAYISYTKLRFHEDNESDNEIGSGVSYALTDWFSLGTDYTYSTESNGYFLEFYLKTNHAFFEDRLNIEPYVLQGVDHGFASDDHDGVNHFQTGIDTSYAITDTLSAHGYVARSWAQNDVERDDLGNLTWAGLGLTLEM